MNQESLDRANAFLAALASRGELGALVDVSPVELGRSLGVDEPLAAARAMRALLARGRVETADGRYRVVDPRPIEPGERETVPRPRRAKARRAGVARRAAAPERPTYSEVGREAIERLLELGREVGTLRANLRSAREEAREAREARDESERRANTLSARVKELEARAEMAESNLRTLLAAARGSAREAQIGDNEMDAILGVLKGEPDEDEPPGGR